MPVVQAVTPIAGRPGEVLLVLGVDILSDGSVREYRGPTPELADPLRLLTDPDAILLTEQYARAHGLKSGDPIRLVTPTGLKAVHRAWPPCRRGDARAMDGQVAVLDIAAAQLHLRKARPTGSVDIVLDAEADPARVAAELRRRLPPQVDVERPEARNAQVEQMLGSFQLNLFVLSLIALFVGAFLVYNTMAVSVVRQRRQIGILRSLGVSRRGILLIVAGEGG